MRNKKKSVYDVAVDKMQTYVKQQDISNEIEKKEEKAPPINKHNFISATKKVVNTYAQATYNNLTYKIVDKNLNSLLKEGLSEIHNEQHYIDYVEECAKNPNKTNVVKFIKYIYVLVFIYENKNAEIIL